MNSLGHKWLATKEFAIKQITKSRIDGDSFIQLWRKLFSIRIGQNHNELELFGIEGES